MFSCVLVLSLRCGAACHQQGCIVWAWDLLTLVCQVYTALEHTVTLTPAVESLQTFGIIMKDYFLLNCPGENAIDWNQARALCESQGATMTHIAEEEKLKLVMQRNGCDHAWIGLQMDIWTAVWYDLDNVTLTNAYWGVGEPEPLYTKASYRMPEYMGLVATLNTARNYAVFCKLHA